MHAAEVLGELGERPAGARGHWRLEVSRSEQHREPGRRVLGHCDELCVAHGQILETRHRKWCRSRRVQRRRMRPELHEVGHDEVDGKLYDDQRHDAGAGDRVPRADERLGGHRGDRHQREDREPRQHGPNVDRRRSGWTPRGLPTRADRVARWSATARHAGVS
ncbi:hypothetical protein ACFPRL_12995 [Pseudoclavibacter helvolus]